MDSDKELFLIQNCFSQEVVEPDFSMGCIIGEKGNDLEFDPQILSPRRFEGNITRGKNQGRTDIHAKLQRP